MLKEYAEQEYKYGFVTKIESDTLPPGLNEGVIKFISDKKGEPEWLTNADDGPKSLDEVDPELIETYNKLGIPLEEQEILAGVAVDAVFDSMSVATTFKDRLAEKGVIFCSISEAVKEHPELIKKYMGSVVPQSDNFYAALNSAVFTDGSFCYIPPNTRCPMELSTYFRINEQNVYIYSIYL